jgi:hypothetical protein
MLGVEAGLVGHVKWEMWYIGTYEVVREDFIVASYEGQARGAGRLADGLRVDCDANVFVAVQNGVEVGEVISLRVLEADA